MDPFVQQRLMRGSRESWGNTPPQIVIRTRRFQGVVGFSFAFGFLQGLVMGAAACLLAHLVGYW